MVRAGHQFTQDGALGGFGMGRRPPRPVRGQYEHVLPGARVKQQLEGRNSLIR
jgi:hypothetical protein